MRPVLRLLHYCICTAQQAHCSQQNTLVFFDALRLSFNLAQKEEEKEEKKKHTAPKSNLDTGLKQYVQIAVYGNPESTRCHSKSMQIFTLEFAHTILSILVYFRPFSFQKGATNLS